MTSEIRNLHLLAQNGLGGFGGMGEGMALHATRDGRRILWLAHESGPKNFTAVDVTDPREPKQVLQTELHQKGLRSNSLDISGDLMAVAYQTEGISWPEPNDPKRVGIELFDISKPEAPRSISFFDCSGPVSRGVHQLWFVDGEYIHCASSAPDFHPHNRLDDQFYRIIDVRDPARPREAGRWWLPGMEKSDAAPPLPRLQKPFDFGFRAHNTNVYPERPDRAYLGMLDGGFVILDISDKSAPKPVSHWNPHPPFRGFSHTALPLFGRDLIVATDETVMDGGADGPKFTWVLDARHEANLVPLSTLPLPPAEEYGGRGGRYGSHNLHENRPGELYLRSDRYVFGAYFNAGLRVYDLADPTRPQEVAHFVPPGAPGGRSGAIQMNDVLVDEKGIIYAVDRDAAGLFVLEPAWS